MYLNLPLMITLFYGGYHMILIDILFILIASKLNEAVRVQGFGDRLLKEALNKIDKDTSRRMNEERVRNGQVVERYIKMKTSQYAQGHRESAPQHPPQNMSFGNTNPESNRPAKRPKAKGSVPRTAFGTTPY